MSKPDNVPVALRDRYNEIIALVDSFCEEHLTQEYQNLCHTLTAKLCRKRPSPITTGKVNTWACAIVYTLGRVNFLFDKSQTPFVRADTLCQHFALSTSTASAKSKTIMDALNIGVMEPAWTLPSRIQSNPMAWMIQVNGLLVDARHMPLEVQEAAFRRGMIPFVPKP